MVWERVVERVGPVLFWYDVIGDGLLLWRDSRYPFATLYKLRDTGATAALTVPLRSVIEPSEAAINDIMFSRLPIRWESGSACGPRDTTTPEPDERCRNTRVRQDAALSVTWFMERCIVRVDLVVPLPRTQERRRF